MKRIALITIFFLLIVNSFGQPTKHQRYNSHKSEYHFYHNPSPDTKDEIKSFYNFMPLVVFFLGLLLLPLTDRIRKNRQLRMLEKYFNELIRLLNQQVSKQTSEIQRCLEQIDDYNQNSFTLTRISGCSVNNLEKLNNEDLFKIYVVRRRKRNKDKISDFRDLNEITNYFKEAIPHLFNSNEKAIDLYDNYRLDWNKSQNNIVDIYNDFITTNNSNGIGKGQDEFVDKLCEIFDTFFEKYGIDVSNIKLGFDEFIKPLIDFSIKYSRDARSYFLLSALQSARHSFKEMMTVREDHKMFLETTLKDMTSFNDLLIDLMKKLKDQKLKLI